MRTFTCYTQDGATSVPTLSFIMAADWRRALELARRELMDALQPVAFELRENGKVVWAETA